jgi:predicted ATPase
MRAVLLTGAPGAGKTTLLQALAARGFAVVSESARAVIRDRLAQGLPPRPPPVEFAQQLLAQDIRNYEASASVGGVAFFDRGVLDSLGMLHAAAPLPPARLAELVAACRYEPVFLFPAWEQIYCTDGERDQSFGQAQHVEEEMRRWVRRCGAEPIEVPLVPVDERFDFVLRRLGVAATAAG